MIFSVKKGMFLLCLLKGYPSVTDRAVGLHNCVFQPFNRDTYTKTVSGLCHVCVLLQWICPRAQGTFSKAKGSLLLSLCLDLSVGHGAGRGDSRMACEQAKDNHSKTTTVPPLWHEPKIHLWRHLDRSELYIYACNPKQRTSIQCIFWGIEHMTILVTCGNYLLRFVKVLLNLHQQLGRSRLDQTYRSRWLVQESDVWSASLVWSTPDQLGISHKASKKSDHSIPEN